MSQLQGTLFNHRAPGEFSAWLSRVSGPEWFWYFKRLSGNDTLLTGSHQAGPYVPKEVAFHLFPQLRSNSKNPRVDFPVLVASHRSSEKDVRLTWYNSKVQEQAPTGRDECRITRWGGGTSPILDPESTGALCIFAFERRTTMSFIGCIAWLCTSVAEEDLFEGLYGPVEPSRWRILDHATGPIHDRAAGGLPAVADVAQGYLPLEPKVGRLSFPDHWLTRFPSGMEIIDYVLELYPNHKLLEIDKRLTRRRDEEFALFRAVEEHAVLPAVRDGFTSVDAFIDYANAVTNRRKSRSGKSLELHMAEILREEGVIGFGHDQETENGKRPDFLFPSVAAYHDPSFPDHKLRMLAAKTTCKDRWRQVLDEASRIKVKHLLTLQEGVTENQFSQMDAAGLKLVIPEGLRSRFPQSLRSELVSIQEFVFELKSVCGT